MEKKLAVIVDNKEEITIGIGNAELCSSACDVAMETCSSECHDTCGSRMLSTKGEFVEILEFDAGNEESSEEARAEKARVYTEFDDCPTTENLVEILWFTHFSRVFKFSGQANFGRKKEIFNEIKVSVVMELV